MITNNLVGLKTYEILMLTHAHKRLLYIHLCKNT